MASLLDNLRKIPESPDQKDQQPLFSQQPSSSRQIAQISHYSDTSSSDHETELNEGFLPRQFAIGEGSSTPKKEPDINEEIPTKQLSSKIMVFTFDDIPFEKWNDHLDEFHAWMNSEAITSPLQMKDLAKHFERQTRRYYALNGLNNPSLKHLSKICSRPDLSIKCSKSKKSCSCGPRERRQKFKKRFSKRPDRFRRKRFFRKKQSSKKSTKCFLCRKEGHFAKKTIQKNQPRRSNT
ncbi:unnamed protein product [Brassica oleracea]